jgi:signal transduction histidine kinase
MTETEREEYLADIASECDREIDLVLNLLDLSRIKAGGVRIESKPTDAAEVVRACEKLVRGEAEQHQQKLSVEIAADLPFILADHSALRRALCAIAENAIKFTPENGQITLRARSVGDEVEIEIEDTGRGIAAEDLPRVFDKFYRGQNAGGGIKASAEEVPGIGLGLNLAQTLIEGMNGAITVESRLGEGSKFIARLPVWSEEADNREMEANENEIKILMEKPEKI